MTRHDDTVSLLQMLDYAREARSLVQGRTLDDLHSDRQLMHALTRVIEIIGEAANRVSAPTQTRFGGIPWSEVIGTRHRLIHAYDQVDLEALWETVRDDLPSLIVALERALEQPRN